VKINWDGRDEDGDQLGNGTYLYKLIVKTTDGEFTQSVLGKMAVVK
jgi:flagellar hook assembly protein FlgD